MLQQQKTLGLFCALAVASFALAGPVHAVDPASPHATTGHTGTLRTNNGVITHDQDDTVAGSKQSTSEAAAQPADTPSIVVNRGSGTLKTTDGIIAIEQVDPLATALRERLNKKTAKGAGKDQQALADFYAGRAHKPIWMEDGALNAKARELVVEIKSADDWGLNAALFALPSSDIGTAESDVADAEIMLSLAALKYARHARGGRVTKPTEQLSSYLDRTPQLKDPAEVLTQLSEADESAAYLQSLHPQHAQFKKLHAKFLELRRAASEQEDVTMPVKGPTLKPGMSHPHVAILRKRLEVAVPTGEALQATQDGKDEADTGPAENRYDEALLEAVKAFQKDNDLTVDGVVGPSTRGTLNGGKAPVTPEVLRANMEQWRWMPDDMGDLYVTVNIPEYTVRVVKNGEVIHSERAIIGKTNNQTPVFSDEMESVVVHPFWGVPNSIKVKELLPGLASGSGQFYKNGLRIQHRGRDIDPSSVDWSTADIRKFHVYQPPGRSNVLGVVKFLFQNKHQVYMHDTPTKHLFKQSKRTYSHGCMRIRNPVRMAEIVLEHDKNWGPDKVARLIKSGPNNNNITLSKKIPVHVTYFTARANEDGEVQAFRDVYGHEKRIKLALAGKMHLVDRGRDHLAPVKYDRRLIAQQKQWSAPMNLFDAFFGGF